MGSHKARVFRHRAEEFRELALSMAPSERHAMLMTAEDYERIAALVEQNRLHEIDAAKFASRDDRQTASALTSNIPAAS